MKKTYSDLHPEIQRVIKERVEEQGNTYNPETAVNQDRFHDGFTWSKAKEGHDFWCSILDDDNEEVFFKKYPKSSKSSFKVGDSVKCTNSNFLFNDCTIIFIDTSESLPCLLYSKKANRAEKGHDGDITKHPDTGAKYGYWWVNFKDVQHNTLVEIPNEYEPIKIGDLVEVIDTKDWESLKLGQRFVIENFSGSTTSRESKKNIDSFNRGESTILINKNKYGVNFRRDMLKIISSQHKLNSNDIQITTLSEQRHAGSTGSGVCHRRGSISTSSGCLSNQAINYSSKRCITSGNIRSSL